MEKLKVLQVSHHYKPFNGGIEKVAAELSERLQKKGYSVEVACLDRNPGRKEKLAAEEVVDGVKVKRLPFIDLKYYKFAPGITALLKKDFDLIHIHNLGFWTDAILLAKRLGLHQKKVVLSSNGGIFHTSKLGGLKKVYFNFWLKFLLKGIDKVIAISKNDFQEFNKIVSPPKLVLIEEGVELEKFSRLKRKREKNRFIFVGRISTNKRLEDLVEAFAQAKGENRLMIVGKDGQNLVPRLKEKAKALGVEKRIEFAGELSEKRLLEEYARAEFFVSASEFEGFGLSVVEAMASGLIPVLNNIGSFQAFVSPGKNGFLTNYSNTGKAAAALSQATGLKASERKRLSENARQTSRRFDWRIKIDEFMKTYKDALEGGK
jgi:alpha-1,3-mannosyltransferase